MSSGPGEDSSEWPTEDNTSEQLKDRMLREAIKTSLQPPEKVKLGRYFRDQYLATGFAQSRELALECFDGALEDCADDPRLTALILNNRVTVFVHGFNTGEDSPREFADEVTALEQAFRSLRGKQYKKWRRQNQAWTIAARQSICDAIEPEQRPAAIQTPELRVVGGTAVGDTVALTPAPEAI